MYSKLVRLAFLLMVPLIVAGVLIAPAATARAGPAAQVSTLIPEPVNVTAATGQRVVGTVISWQGEDGGLPVEQLAGLNPKNELLVFFQRNAEPWRVVNVSKITGRKVIGPVTQWETNGVNYLAARGLQDELLIFSWTLSRDWQVEDISKITNERITSPPIDWQSGQGLLDTSESLAARGRGGRLLVFTRTTGQWQVQDLTTVTGQTVADSVVYYKSARNYERTVQLAGQGHDGNLLVFIWSRNGGWRAENVSERTGRKIAGPVAAWQSEPGFLPLSNDRLVARGKDGALLHFRYLDLINAWLVEDVTQSSGGQTVAGAPAAYRDADTAAVAAVRDRADALVLYWVNEVWRRVDLTAITRHRIAYDPHGYLFNGQERIAAVDRDKNLLVFGGFTPARLLTNGLGKPFHSLRAQTGPRKVLTILWDAGHPDQPPQRHTPETIRRTLFGADNSVLDLLLENSNDHLPIKDAGVHGWYQADKAWQHYWNESCATDPTDSDGDGWLDGHVEKRTEAIRKADPAVDFAAFDVNRDRVLTPDELGIVIVFPATRPSGYTRAVVGRQYPPPNGQCTSSPETLPHDPLVVDGVTLTEAAEFYAGTDPSVSVPAHELSHLLLGTLDMYGDFSSRAGIYSLMDESHSGTHLDPFHKLKLGWVNPQIIFRSGTYSLRAVQGSHDVWVLMDPARGTDEYFIIENRWRKPNSYDAVLPDDGGLAVWHVMENPAVYSSAPPPPFTDPAIWDFFKHDPGRRAVQMIRPVWSSPPDDAVGLWDDAQPGAGHDLLSVDPDPTHGSLLWADGTPSGFSLHDISAAGQVMTARIEVP